MKPVPPSQPAEDTMPIGAVVARLREEFPDVTHSSLRFLEREGLLSPFRTPGGHRLYTDADVSRVASIKRWQQQHLSLEDIRALLERADRLPDLSDLSRAFVDEGAKGLFSSAARLVIGADDVGVPLVRTFDEVLVPAMIEVGYRWEKGEFLVSQEKQFSEVATELVIELSRRHLAKDPHGTPLVAACVKGTRHQLGLRMLVGVLRAEGYRVHYLGADVDLQFMVEAARMHQPKGILLSADLPELLPAVDASVSALKELGEVTTVCPIIVGGRGIAGSSGAIRDMGAIPMAGGSIANEVAGLMTAVPPDRG
jgi:MerR family transcriptional regulator, light-induced transcriptional regulator